MGRLVNGRNEWRGDEWPTGEDQRENEREAGMKLEWSAMEWNEVEPVSSMGRWIPLEGYQAEASDREERRSHVQGAQVSV